MINMNSTKILFLNMLKGDIKRHIFKKNNSEVLTGQTISRNVIESFSSYKLMNNDEREIVLNILKSMMNPSGNEKGKMMLKAIPGLVPMENDAVDFKEAA